MKYFIHSSVLIGIFFLGGCSLLSLEENTNESKTTSSQEEEITSTPVVPEVTVQKLIPRKAATIKRLVKNEKINIKDNKELARLFALLETS